MTRLLKPESLTQSAFASFGDVVSTDTARERRAINYGQTDRFHDLARLDLTAQNGQPIISLFRTKPLPRPIPIKVMERHPLSSQAFYPLSGRPYLVVVAPSGDFDARGIRVFLAQGDQGVNYHAGTWHHFSLALDGISDFLVIDRDGPEKNCDEVFIEGEKLCIDL